MRQSPGGSRTARGSLPWLRLPYLVDHEAFRVDGVRRASSVVVGVQRLRHGRYSSSFVPCYEHLWCEE